MYNHTEAAVQKQMLVKEALSDYPYYLADCLVVKAVKVATSLNKEFEIYRVEVTLKGEVGYLDLITTISHSFKAVGGFYKDMHSTHLITETICESLAVQAYIEEAY